MKQSYTIKISGMTCHACEKLITMDLEEAGFTPISINHQTGELKINLDPADIDRVQQVIAATKTYHVTNVQSI